MTQTGRRERTGAAFYTVTQMAALFGVTTWTIYGWARKRRVPVLRVGGSLRFPRAAVDRFIARETVEPR